MNGMMGGLPLKNAKLYPSIRRIMPNHAGLVVRQILKEGGVDRFQMVGIEVALDGVRVEFSDTIGNKIGFARFMRRGSRIFVTHNP